MGRPGVIVYGYREREEGQELLSDINNIIKE